MFVDIKSIPYSQLLCPSFFFLSPFFFSFSSVNGLAIKQSGAAFFDCFKDTQDLAML